MRIGTNAFKIIKQNHVEALGFYTLRRCYNRIPFLDLYQSTIGGYDVPENFITQLKKNHPNILGLSHDRLQCTIQILEKFGITALEACQNPHLFCMNPITVDNHAEILRECGFIKIIPKYIIRYHTLVRSRTISHHKTEGLLRNDLVLEKVLKDFLHEWPDSHKSLKGFPDASTSILTVRMSVLEEYLNWRLLVTADDFKKYCRHYLPLKHKPLSVIQEALNIAQNEVQFDIDIIRKNGFIIMADPINTKLIIKHVGSVAGLDIREAIKAEPAILKNNYSAILQIKKLLEECRIPEEAQRRCLRVYCMCPETVRERLDELKSLKEYQVLSSNPRVLSMVIHKKKMMTRLRKIQAAKKQCYSLNHLVSSSKVFNNYINNFGNKACGRDIAILISSSLELCSNNKEELVKFVLKQLRQHKYWLHSALNVVDANIKFLKKMFSDKVILNNCQLLLYPVSEIKQQIQFLIKLRDDEQSVNGRRNIHTDASYSNLSFGALTDHQILSLVLYEIEKKYHFSGDGIWAKQEPAKFEVSVS